MHQLYDMIKNWGKKTKYFKNSGRSCNSVSLVRVPKSMVVSILWGYWPKLHTAGSGYPCTDLTNRRERERERERESLRGGGSTKGWSMPLVDLKGLAGTLFLCLASPQCVLTFPCYIDIFGLTFKILQSRYAWDLGGWITGYIVASQSSKHFNWMLVRSQEIV